MEECCGTLVQGVRRNFKTIHIREVENGYVVDGCFPKGQLIANTLPEALEFVRKELQ